MRILLISNMYPSKEKPYAGIFVKNQYEELKDQLGPEDEAAIYFMRRRITTGLGTGFKYAKAAVGFIPYMFRRFDLIHLHFFYPLIYLVYLYKKLHPGVKVLVTFHGSDINFAVNERNRKHLSFLAGCVDFAIPVGATLAREVSSKLSLTPGAVLPVGVDGRVFYPMQNAEKIYDFVWVGSFKQLKGSDLMNEAVRKLDRKDVSFCFCGSGPYLDRLKDLQKDFRIVIKENLTQAELSHVLNQSKFFVLLSRNEGFPTATIEAMYCGVPVLTSDIPQFMEQVRNGINGYRIPAGDVKAVADKMEEILDLDEQDYRNLRKEALNSFRQISLQHVCSELIKIYRSLIR